jgi:molybdate transport system ATP-binding protein
MLQVSLEKKLAYFTLRVNFQVDNDQIVVLWGPSGSGKTTILECLAGLCLPNAGNIELSGQCLYSSGEDINIPARNRRVGYLFQDYALFPHMTVKKNILYGLRSNKQITREDSVLNYKDLLETFGLSHLTNRFPGQLSGGEKQRVALIRALVVQPHLLLLDEPFSALDHQSKRKLRQEIISLHKNWQIPMVLVTHDEEDAAELGDIIISISQGQIIAKKLL